MTRSIVSNAIIAFAYFGIINYFEVNNNPLISVFLVATLIVAQDYLTEYVYTFSVKRITLNIIVGVAAQSINNYSIELIFTLAVLQDCLTIISIRGNIKVLLLVIMVILIILGWSNVANALLEIGFKKAIQIMINKEKFFPILVYIVPIIVFSLALTWATAISTMNMKKE